MTQKLRWAVLIGGLSIGILLILTVVAVQVTSTPEFCGSCHIMQPYYQSWKTSTHTGIACVECHIPPGLGSEVRKKFEALAMIARYVTGTYSTNPWAEVEDAACLRCHDKRLIQGKVLFGKVLFDHRPHLLELRRGKKLRCTSCHSQIVQGSHVTVTPSTCFLCHFKDVPVGKGTARCQLCHVPPQGIVESQGIQFNHGDVTKYGMRCVSCHAKSVRGTGEVPKERCLSCHNRPDRLAKYTDPPLLHRIHVTDHKVECLNCHLEIQHGPIPLEAAGTACNVCHTQGHSPVRDLYAGIGGKGVSPIPSKMFLTGISCEGCHILPDTLQGGLRRAGDVSCMSCHGPKYSRLYREWQTELQEAMSQFEEAWIRWGTRLGNTNSGRAIRANWRLIQNGKPIHNPAYALSILKWNYETLLKEAGIRRAPSWPEIPYPTPCSSCHPAVTFQKGTWKANMVFRHAIHVSQKKISCERCHRPHEERTGREVLRPGVSCLTCHHQKPVQQDCSSCHRTLPKILTLKNGEEFPHAFHVGEDVGAECSDCHNEKGRVSPSICEDCHG